MMDMILHRKQMAGINRGERIYSWSSWIRRMPVNKPIPIEQFKNCRKAPNAALQAARRLGIRIQTTCRECPDDPGKTILTVTRPAAQVRLP